jgi:hypothetical protein
VNHVSHVLAHLARPNGELWAWFGAGLVVGAAALLSARLVIEALVAPGSSATASAGPIARPTPPPVRVQVAGEVAHPGIFDLPPTARVEDALQQAGGPTAEADTSRLNLVARVVDGERVVVARQAAASGASRAGADAGVSQSAAGAGLQGVPRAPDAPPGGSADAAAGQVAAGATVEPGAAVAPRSRTTSAPRPPPAAGTGSTPRPTATPWPTGTQRPTATPWPTPTPHPTATPWPTRTPMVVPTLVPPAEIESRVAQAIATLVVALEWPGPVLSPTQVVSPNASN